MKRRAPPQKNGGVRFSAQSGMTLVEVIITASIVSVVFIAFARLTNDYMLSAKTLSVGADANVEMLRLLKNITMTFQRSLPEVDAVTGNKQSRARGCVLTGGDGLDINTYSCADEMGGAVVSAGVGFKLDTNNVPSYAYVNACEDIPDGMVYPLGRGKLTAPPEDLQGLSNWGALNSVCPAACGANQRPMIRFLSRDSERDPPLQLPRRIESATDSSALYLWGAVLCASYFRDEVRDLQLLYGDNVGGFLPNYLNITAFIARARFDVRVEPPRSPYVWVHGGTVLEFNATQELSTYRCRPGETGEYGCLDDSGG